MILHRYDLGVKYTTGMGSCTSIMFVGKDKERGMYRGTLHCTGTCIVDRCNLVKAQSFGLRNLAFRLSIHIAVDHTYIT